MNIKRAALMSTKAPVIQSGYKMVAKGSDRAEIYIYGIIGLASDNFFGVDGVTAKQFADDLNGLGAVKNLDVRINSDGGVVNDARAISALLKKHPAKVAVHIDGIAASAASLIAMVGDTIAIAEGAWIMIHNAQGGVSGTSEQIRAYADIIEGYSQAAIATYAGRTKQSPNQIKKWMDAETWFVGPDAVKNGFADTMVPDLKIAACISRPELFKKLPTCLLPKRARASAQIAALKRA